MVNNVGKTEQALSTQLGGATQFTNSEDITILTGELGKGFLLFDSVGTLGVVTDYTDETNFTITTHALSIDINSILNLSY